GVGPGQVDRWTFQERARGSFEARHILVVRRAGQVVGYPRSSLRVERPVFPHPTHKAARGPGEPVAVAGAGKQPMTIHDESSRMRRTSVAALTRRVEALARRENTYQIRRERYQLRRCCTRRRPRANHESNPRATP